MSLCSGIILCEHCIAALQANDTSFLGVEAQVSNENISMAPEKVLPTKTPFLPHSDMQLACGVTAEECFQEEQL